jgi:hypothetical protein
MAPFHVLQLASLPLTSRGQERMVNRWTGAILTQQNVAICTSLVSLLDVIYFRALESCLNSHSVTWPANSWVSLLRYGSGISLYQWVWLCELKEPYWYCTCTVSPSRDKKCVSSSEHPDWLWGPFSLLIIECQTFLPQGQRGQDVRLNGCIHIVLRCS